MPRILLGVCGGIAAYKALEFTRLATKAGHSVRVVQTEAATRFVGPASFAGITGAPVLITEWEPDPLRGVFPGDPLPEHAPLSHLALVEHADAYLIAPATAHTLAKLATGARRQPADRRRARMPATADRRSGHEQRDVRASGHAGEPRDAARPRRHRAASRAPARSARRGSSGSAACPSRPSCWPPSKSRCPAAATSTGSTSWSARAGRASRSTPCASSATARAGAWGSRSPRRPSAAAPT